MQVGKWAICECGRILTTEEELNGCPKCFEEFKRKERDMEGE